MTTVEAVKETRNIFSDTIIAIKMFSLSLALVVLSRSLQDGDKNNARLSLEFIQILTQDLNL
jgi:hypothetical protein